MIAPPYGTQGIAPPSILIYLILDGRRYTERHDRNCWRMTPACLKGGKSLNDDCGRIHAPQQPNSIDLQPSAQIDPAPTAATAVVALMVMPGGIALLQDLAANLPRSANAAYIVSCRLPDDQHRQVFAWLRSHALMPVVELGPAAVLRPNQVHLLPPGLQMEAAGGSLHLHEPRVAANPGEEALEAADGLLTALAAVFGARLAVVLLGSSGLDGCTAMLGVNAVRNRNGLTLAVNAGPYRTVMGATITAPGQAVLEPDLVLGPQQTLQRLHAWVHGLATAPKEEESAPWAELRHALPAIQIVLHRHTGYNFSLYDPAYCLGRLMRRLRLHNMDSGEAYVRLLERDETEAGRLAADLLASQSYFFRGPAAFRVLSESVGPRLLADKTGQDSVRVWSVGCAGGEEPYSLAMALLDCLAQRSQAPSLRIFASDVNRSALQQGRSGSYCTAVLGNVSAERRQRYFVPDFLNYSVAPALREVVYFAQHDVLVDPPFGRLDLIACRDLLPSFSHAARLQLLEVFALALQPQGCLMLGPEDELPRTDLFRPVAGEVRLYMRREPSSIRHRRVPPAFRYAAGGPERTSPAPKVDYAALLTEVRGADERPSLLVNGAGSLLYADANATAFLHQPSGEPTTLLSKLLLPALQLPALAALKQAHAAHAAVRAPAQTILVGGAPRHVAFTATPVDKLPELDLLLLQFEELEAVEGAATEEPAAQVSGDQEQLNAVAMLTALQEISGEEAGEEGGETAEGVEDVSNYARNEELQLLIEELRVTLDEVEWRKREQVEANRQLAEVNRLYAEKIAELNRLAGDLHNLLNASDVVTIFVDRDLLLKRFTPNAATLFQLQPGDLGRRFTDIAHRLRGVNLEQDAYAVLEQLAPIEREARDEDGRWQLMRALPYRALDGSVDGVVFTFVDITRQKEADAALRRNEERLWLAVDAGHVGIYEHDVAADVTEGTPLYFAIMHLPPESKPTRAQWLEMIHPEDRDRIEAGLLRMLKEGGERQFECRIVLPDESVRWIGCSSVASLDENGRPERITGAVQDITERKQAEEALREWNATLETRVADRTRELERSNRELDQFAYVASHDLKAPLRAIVSLARWIDEDAAAVLPPQSQEHLAKLMGRTKRMEALLDDLLSYSRVTRQRHPTVVVDTANLVRGVCDLLDLPEGFAVEIAPAMPVLTTERVPLETVLRNLISNAIKHHNRPHEGVVRVSASVDGERAVFTVADNGPGIDPSHHERIFQIFQTLKPRSEVEGSGMGLAVVKRLVETRGGGVWVDSVLGQGAAFHFTWPVR